MTQPRPVTISAIQEAAWRLAGHVARTPLRLSPYLSKQAGHPVRLKLESMQDTGAFKLRGATNALLTLKDAARRQGVLTLSSGNHGRGLAHAAQRLGVKCIVHMSSLVPDVKVQAIRDLGAEVVISGRTQDEAEIEALKQVARDGLTYVHPFDDPNVIAGQGSIGLEILEDMPDVANVLVPLSGGGLFAGVALAIKSLKPNARLIGISMENGPAMIHSLQAGHVVPVDEVATLADALGGGIGTDNTYTFEMTRQLIDETLVLSEDEIAAAMRTLFVEDRIVAEGGGAVGVGALLSGRLSLNDGPTAIVISGCNVDMKRFLEIVG